MTTAISLPVLRPGVPASPRCAGCGKCCERMPGAYFPGDLSLAALPGLLESGRVVLDCWHGDPREPLPRWGERLDQAYYPRPAIVDGDLVYDHPWVGGRCVNLTDAGCSLAWNDRPTECRFLAPGAGDDSCLSVGSTAKRDAAAAWIPYQDELRAMGDEALIEAKLKGGGGVGI